MSNPTEFQLTLLDELDARQNDVLAELDTLNGRVEELLKRFTNPNPRSEDVPPPTAKAA